MTKPRALSVAVFIVAVFIASAFAADPRFALNEKEIGHPVWGPVYRRIAAERARL